MCLVCFVSSSAHQEGSCVHDFTSPSVCLSLQKSVCLSVCLSVCRCRSLSVCLSVVAEVGLSVCLSLQKSACLWLQKPVCLSVVAEVCLSVPLSLQKSCLSICCCKSLSVCSWFRAALYIYLPHFFVDIHTGTQAGIVGFIIIIITL